MTITGQNFEVRQGDNKQLIIIATDDDGEILNLTGYKIVWVAYKLTTGELVITKSSENVGEIEFPSPGEIQINLESADTENLPAKSYGHQCEIEDAFGQHSTITEGQMSIVKSYTHSQL